jgi:hypothetical protein
MVFHRAVPCSCKFDSRLNHTRLSPVMAANNYKYNNHMKGMSIGLNNTYIDSLGGVRLGVRQARGSFSSACGTFIN